MSTERVKTNSSGAAASGVQKPASWPELQCIDALGGSAWSSDLLTRQPVRIGSETTVREASCVRRLREAGVRSHFWV